MVGGSSSMVDSEVQPPEISPAKPGMTDVLFEAAASLLRELQQCSLPARIKKLLTCFHRVDKMSALFNFQSALLVLLLLICTSAYVHQLFPGIMDRNKDGMFVGVFWKSARIGERLSPYISVCCILYAAHLFIGN